MTKGRIGIIGFLFAGAFAFGACGDEGKDALNKIKEKACACKDAACVAEVQKDLMAVMEKETRDPEGAAKIGQEIVECISKVGQ